MTFKIGDRVVTPGGEVGYLEAIYTDPADVDVRVQTPRDEPSCCITGGFTVDDLKDGTNVLPQPRSEAWWRESIEFCAHINAALEDAGI